MTPYKTKNICKLNSAANVKTKMPHALYRYISFPFKRRITVFKVAPFAKSILTSPDIGGIIILTPFRIATLFQKEISMADSKKKLSDKIERLKAHGALNPHPEKVTYSLFIDSSLEFFDPNDLVQVKYEMLRSVEKEGCSVTNAAKKFGFSRPSFYQAQSEFKKHGVAGLTRGQPGPKSAHKLTDEVMEFIDKSIKEGQPLRSRMLAPKIKKRFGVEIHPRTIERAVARREKKESAPKRKR
jgi:transposase